MCQSFLGGSLLSGFKGRGGMWRRAYGWGAGGREKPDGMYGRRWMIGKINWAK